MIDTNYSLQVNALAAHLECDCDDVEATQWGTFVAESEEWLVLTDGEADSRAFDDAESILWAFSAQHLAHFMPEGIDADEIDRIRGDRCEDAQTAIVALLSTRKVECVKDAIGCDGRGHFLSSYDGEEVEVSLETEQGRKDFYLFRTN